MDLAAQIDAVVALALKLGFEIRREHLGGDGGGFCTIRGRKVLFLDDDADLAVMLHRCLEGLATLPGIEQFYLPPEIRERMENLG